jgi:beta-lactamase superfamily II metal-dependent hydrolase
MTIRVRLLRANHGDCILVSHESADGTFNLLIDGGNPATFRHGPRLRYDGELCVVLDEIKKMNQVIDLAILTHIDDDHIGGLIRAFETSGYLQDLVKAIWFNSSKYVTDYFSHDEIPENDVRLSDVSPDTSAQQGKALEDLLEDIGCERRAIVKAGQVISQGPFTFRILSPNESDLRKLLRVWPYDGEAPETTGKETDHSLSFDEIWADDEFKEDVSFTNGSSIAFIAEADGKSMLFLGDAHDKTVVESLKSLDFSSEKKLSVDLVKISHHGSQHNTSTEFLEMIEAKKFLISTDGSRHGLPDKRTIARILSYSEEGLIYFNYSCVIESLLLPSEISSYSCRLHSLTEKIEY